MRAACSTRRPTWRSRSRPTPPASRRGAWLRSPRRASTAPRSACRAWTLHRCGCSGREHSAAQAVAALETARRIFPRLSFDLIYARPGQTMDAWQAELAQALALAADHLSLYQLTIEPGTAFEGRYRRGEFVLPDDDDAADLYLATAEAAARHGLAQYEISNYAAPGAESRHNLAYWRYADYAGIGPGAHGRVTLDGQIVGTRRHRAPEPWAERVERLGHGSTAEERIAPPDRAREMLLMGLRLAEGVDEARFAARCGMDLDDAIDTGVLQQATAEGYRHPRRRPAGGHRRRQAPAGLAAGGAGALTGPLATTVRAVRTFKSRLPPLKSRSCHHGTARAGSTRALALAHPERRNLPLFDKPIGPSCGMETASGRPPRHRRIECRPGGAEAGSNRSSGYLRGADRFVSGPPGRAGHGGGGSAARGPRRPGVAAAAPGVARRRTGRGGRAAAMAAGREGAHDVPQRPGDDG